MAASTTTRNETAQETQKCITLTSIARDESVYTCVRAAAPQGEHYSVPVCLYRNAHCLRLAKNNTSFGDHLGTTAAHRFARVDLEPSSAVLQNLDCQMRRWYNMHTRESVRDPPHLRPRQKHACDVHRAAASAGAVAACAPIRVRGSEGDGERAMNAPVEPNARAIREDLSQSEHRPSDVCTYSFDIQCCL